MPFMAAVQKGRLARNISQFESSYGESARSHALTHYVHTNSVIRDVPGFPPFGTSVLLLQMPHLSQALQAALEGCFGPLCTPHHKQVAACWCSSLCSSSASEVCRSMSSAHHGYDG